MTEIPINCSGIPLHGGKVGVGLPCCCGECSCDCDCTITATLRGVPIPLNAGRFIICTTQDQAQFFQPWLGGDMALSSAEMKYFECDPQCGVYSVWLTVFYAVVVFNADGDIPAVGDFYQTAESGGVTTGGSVFQSPGVTRIYRFKSCDENGCPSGQPSQFLPQGDTTDAWPPKPCFEEMRTATMTRPQFIFDCANPLP